MYQLENMVISIFQTIIFQTALILTVLNFNMKKEF